MAKVKTIDPFDVKAAVKAGQLGVHLYIDQKRNVHVMLRDEENGECAELKTLEGAGTDRPVQTADSDAVRAVKFDMRRARDVEAKSES